jgi:HEAT repeat protein
MAMPPNPLVAQVGGLLDRLVACRRQDNDEQEAVCDEVAAEARALPREGLLEALDIAVGPNKKRREEAVYILSELTDISEAVARIGQCLNDPNPQLRSRLIQIVANRGMRQFASLLNDIIERDPDPFCRETAVHAAGSLRQKENLPTLFRLADRNEQELNWRLAAALKSYATEECRPFLRRWFEDAAQNKSTRVFAAWGLGKLGDQNALEYLIAKLQDPDDHTPKSFEPGESIRAAQAVCDIHGWPFEWNKAYVGRTIARVEEWRRTTRST